MTNTVFEFVVRRNQAPVTVFARDHEEAEQIYRRWHAAHRPGEPDEIVLIHPYNGKLLEARPLLHNAARLRMVGVGYWSEREQRWHIDEPGTMSKLPIAPPQGDVNCYRIDSYDGQVALVFARSHDEALTFFFAMELDGYGVPPERIEVRHQSRWSLVLALAVLRDEMDAGITGIARWSAGEGWCIAPPEHGMDLSGLGV